MHVSIEDIAVSNVIVLPNLPSQLGRFFGEFAGQHIPELLDRLEDYLRKIAKIIDECPEGDRKVALIAHRATLFGLLARAREKANRT